MTSIRLVTANVDFTLRPEKVKEDLAYIIKHADIITFQEAKRVDIDALIRDPDWEVVQPMKNDATKGSGVAWRKSAATRKRRGKKIGTNPRGRAMLTRYIVWVKLDIDGQRVTVASLHMPPKRFWNVLYAAMLGSLRVFLKARRTPIIIGADWNKLVLHADDLEKLAREVGGTFVGRGIDGFLLVLKGKFKHIKTRKLKDTNSDHDPVQTIIKKLTRRRKA